MGVFTTLARRQEKLTPSQFLALTAEQRSDIKKARIVAPTLGSKGFGEIEVTYRTPRYVVSNEK